MLYKLPIYANRIDHCVKTWTLNAGSSGLIPKKNRLTLTSVILPFYVVKVPQLSGLPESLGVYFS